MFQQDQVSTNGSTVFDQDASFFASILVLGICHLTLLSTVGFEVPYFQLYVVTGISLLLVNSGKIGRSILKGPIPRGSNSVVLAILFLGLLLISQLPEMILRFISPLLALLGFIAFGWGAYEKRGRGTGILFLSVMAISLGTWMIGTMYSNSIHHPLYLERLALGTIHIDQLFHASIAEMIRTYGVPSTGLQGVPYVPYHFGSHLIIATLSDLVGMNALQGYNLLYPVLLLPLYIRVVLHLVQDLGMFLGGLISDWVFWLAMCMIVVGLIPNSLTGNIALRDVWIYSESYLVSITFGLMSMSILIWLYENESRRLHAVLISLLLFVLLALCGLSKISVIFVLGLAIMFLVVRSGAWRSPLALLCCVYLIAVIVFVVLYASNTTSTATHGNIQLLHFVKTYVAELWRPMFIPLYFLILIAYVLIRWSSYTDLTLRDLLKSKKIMDIEFLVVIAAVGMLPGMILRIEGSSAGYFSDIQWRLSTIFLLSWLLSRHGRDLSRAGTSGFWRTVGLKAIILVALILFANNIFSRLEDYMHINAQLRWTIAAQSPVPDHSGQYSGLYQYFSGTSGEIVYKAGYLLRGAPAAMKNSEVYQYYRWLSDTTSAIEGKNRFMISIDDSDPAWTRLHQTPEAAPFIFPALTGMALTNGLPKDFHARLFAHNPEFDYFHFYGYPTYYNRNNAGCAPGEFRLLKLRPLDRSLPECIREGN